MGRNRLHHLQQGAIAPTVSASLAEMRGGRLFMSRGLVCPRPPQYATAPECTLPAVSNTMFCRYEPRRTSGLVVMPFVVLRRLIDLIENRMIVVAPGSIGKAWWSAIQRKTDREGMTAS